MAFWSKKKTPGKFSDAVTSVGGTKPPTSPSAPPPAAPEKASSPAPAAAPPKGEVRSNPSADTQTSKQQAAATAKLRFAQLGEIIALLIGSPRFKHYALADLEWLVLPPVKLGQFAIAEAQSKSTGERLPAGIVLWASVSAPVDRRLSASLDQPVRLQPDEWNSGDILWVIATAGESRVVEALVHRLLENDKSARNAKMRTQREDGKTKIVVLAKGQPEPNSS